MSITKEELIAALEQLDPENPQHWTDDGSPRISIVRSIAKNETITRQNVNEAMPGFNRKPSDAAVAAAQLMADPSTDQQPSNEPETDQTLLETDEGYDPTGEPLTQEEVRAIMVKRVQAAEEAVTQCQLDIRNANAALTRAQTKAAKAKRDLVRRFPPISAAANIKQHLAAHQHRREEAAAVIDTVLSNRQRRPQFVRPASAAV